MTSETLREEREGETGRIQIAEASQTEWEPRQRQKDRRVEGKHRLAVGAQRTEHVLECRGLAGRGPGRPSCGQCGHYTLTPEVTGTLTAAARGGVTVGHAPTETPEKEQE